MLQELGHLATILIALPVALLLGFKREAIGMTNSIGREPEVAVVVDKYGFNSAESRGIFALFIVGTMIGTVFISFLTSICVSILPLHPSAAQALRQMNIVYLCPGLSYGHIHQKLLPRAQSQHVRFRLT